MDFRLLIIALCFPLTLHASFIESTMGTAVVNDATATYHNPAALSLIKKPQFIALGSYALFPSYFVGQSISYTGAVNQSGQSKADTDYFLPSIYASIPIQDKIKVGFSVLSDLLNSEINEASILRYLTANNKIENVDFVSGLDIDVNEYLSIGAGFVYSHARFTSNPIIGLGNLITPDSQSHNVTADDGYGGNIGFLIKPMKSTLIGFNYRSAVAYQFRGNSYFNGTPAIMSSNYNFNFWTPARGVLTISHFISPSMGFIGTVQAVEWGIFKNVVNHNLATQINQQSIVIPQAVVPFNFHNSWIFTAGGIKYFTPQWVVRLASTYNQSPSNGKYRITNGDSIDVGVSMGYEIYKNIIIDGSYAHIFIKNQNINIYSKNSLLIGVNKGFGDAISLKLTLKGS